ncbi:hypothetical protein HID58_009872 [Brassica napus]|uniref:Large ribosomal subunit protein bL12 C-terminal domain-containing protein n=1 Tax=Brassica napus TaxID=3708 RepID=A0ABQ8DWB3_BRANA|nr:hypothetical protein HID58_009872 [Brassica napus]
MTLSLATPIFCSSFSSTYRFGAPNSCTPSYRAAELSPISATAAAAAVFSPPLEDGDDVRATVEEPTKFDMVINDVAIGHRMEVAKAMRALSVPLSQVTELTKDFPKIFMEGVTKDEAEEAKRQLEEAGATVSIV